MLHAGILSQPVTRITRCTLGATPDALGAARRVQAERPLTPQAQVTTSMKVSSCRSERVVAGRRHVRARARAVPHVAGRGDGGDVRVFVSPGEGEARGCECTG